MRLIKLGEIFYVTYGVNLELNKMEIVNYNADNAIPFVSRTSENNGVSAFVNRIDEIKPNPGHTISVAGSGSVLESFYQGEPYYSGRDLFYLKPKESLTKEELLAYCTYIKANKYKYSYGRQANKTLDDITVPVIDYITRQAQKYKKIVPPSSSSYHKKQVKLSDRKWGIFKINDLFDIKGSKSYTKEQIQCYEKGRYPYVTTSSKNNGAENFYNHYTENGNILTIDSATVGSCFYQPCNFSASGNVEKLVPKFDANVYIALFIKTIIGFEKFRYNYGRKFSQKRIQSTTIKLPVDDNNQPDWQFMEDYIKSLPYSSNLQERLLDSPLI